MKRTFQALTPVILLLALMLRADAVRQAAAQAVRQAATVVFPSLFPFFVVSRRLTGLLCPKRGNRLCLRWFGVGAAGLGAVAMGLCGGYPLGVYSACAQYRSGALTHAQAERLITFCNNTGPSIFFGMVGALLFRDPVICACAYLIHILSAALTALLVSDSDGPDPGIQSAPQSPEPFPESLKQAFESAALLCGYVVFFAVLLRLILDLSAVRFLIAYAPFDPAAAEAALCAFVDLPSGLGAMQSVATPAARFVLCAAGIGWGGMCVHLQAASFWHGAGLRVRGYYFAKALQALISCALALAATRLLFAVSAPVWPAAAAILAAALKKTLAFSRPLRYNGKKERQRGRGYAVPQKD